MPPIGNAGDLPEMSFTHGVIIYDPRKETKCREYVGINFSAWANRNSHFHFILFLTRLADAFVPQSQKTLFNNHEALE
eukprot:scaffold1125_cov44-Skeletonema_dohrnii-CCMP3373.AAC.1